MVRLLAVGQLVLDIFASPAGDALFSPDCDTSIIEKMGTNTGGDALNAAVVAKRLGCGVRIVGRVGYDDFGSLLISKLRAEGLDVSGLKYSSSSATSTTIVLIRGDGERHFLHSPAANGELCSDDVSDAELYACDYLLTSGFFNLPSLDGSGTAELLSRAKAFGKMTFMDVNFDSQGRWFELLRHPLAFVDFFMPSEGEARLITGESEPEAMADFLLRAGVKNVVIKLGERGCFVKNEAVRQFVPAFAAPNVVDTTGAGDNFVAGFISEYGESGDILKAAAFGCAAGALCVGSIGAATAVTSRAQVQAAMESLPVRE